MLNIDKIFKRIRESDDAPCAHDINTLAMLIDQLLPENEKLKEEIQKYDRSKERYLQIGLTFECPCCHERHHIEIKKAE